jgi:hypothetical protein
MHTRGGSVAGRGKGHTVFEYTAHSVQVHQNSLDVPHPHTGSTSFPKAHTQNQNPDQQPVHVSPRFQPPSPHHPPLQPTRGRPHHLTSRVLVDACAVCVHVLSSHFNCGVLLLVSFPPVAWLLSQALVRRYRMHGRGVALHVRDQCEDTSPGPRCDASVS